MKFKAIWNRQLHQSVNSRAFLVCGNDVYVAEKVNKLSNIDLITGDEKWSIKIPSTWGWLGSFKSFLYYMSQSGDLTVVDRLSGNIEGKGKLNSFYPGYIIPSENVLIAGGWRGYSDLYGYDSSTYKVMWSRSVRNKELQKFSVPYLLGRELLLSVNHSLSLIEIIDIHTGKVRNEISLPKNLDCPDLDHSFQVVSGKVTFASRDGMVYTLTDDYSKIQAEELGVKYISTVLPYLSPERIIYEDESGYYCLFDRKERKIIWRIKVENNCKTKIYACELSNDVYLVGGSLGQLKVIGSDGDTYGCIKSEKRITTQIRKVGELIVYCNKSEVKVLRWEQ